MQILEMIVISLQITTMFARKKYKKYRVESDESIENVIYYKDCKKGDKNKEQTTTPAMNFPLGMQYRATPTPEIIQPICPCPRMCCSMCCDCGVQPSQSFISQQMGPNEFSNNMMISRQKNTQPRPNMPNIPMPVQPQIQKNFRAKKFHESPAGHADDFMLPPIGSRRAFTKENIKTLLAKDQEIRKILKELVRVTMHKVDLVKAANTRRNMMSTTPQAEASSNESYEEDDGQTILIED